MHIVCAICNQRDCYGYSMHVFMERAWMGVCVCVCVCVLKSVGVK